MEPKVINIVVIWSAIIKYFFRRFSYPSFSLKEDTKKKKKETFTYRVDTGVFLGFCCFVGRLTSVIHLERTKLKNLVRLPVTM